jgi:hemoglobin
MMLNARLKPVLLAFALLVVLSGCGTPATPEQMKNEPMLAPGEETLYDRLGGGSAVYAITDNFVDRIIQDPRVNFGRQGHDHVWVATPDSVARLKLYWAQYFDMLTDGPQVYEGRNLMNTHHGMDISEGEWLALVEDLKQTFDQFHIPEDQQHDFITRLASTHDAIASK